MKVNCAYCGEAGDPWEMIARPIICRHPRIHEGKPRGYGEAGRDEARQDNLCYVTRVARLLDGCLVGFITPSSILAQEQAGSTSFGRSA